MDDQFKALRDALANAPTSAVYTHPRDDNRWEANEAFAYACAPETIRALLAEVEALRKAAQAVVDRWDSPTWEWHKQGPTADLIGDLRTALRARGRNHELPHLR